MIVRGIILINISSKYNTTFYLLKNALVYEINKQSCGLFISLVTITYILWKTI